MHISNKELADALIRKKILDVKTITKLLSSSSNQETSLENLILSKELLPNDTLGQVIADFYKTPFIKLTDKNIGESLLRIVPFKLASHQYVIPFEKLNNEVSIAFNCPNDYELVSTLERKTGLVVKPFYATKKDIKAALKAYNRDINAKFTKLLKSVLADPTKIESLKDASKILDTIILFAYQNNASDIHMEPHDEFLVIRYRIDGILQTIAELPIAILDLVTTRVKVLSNLRTDEHRAAQDGRFKIDLEKNEITLRVSILPTYDGEKTVLRLLSSSNQELNVKSLGYSDHNLEIIHNNIEKTNGIILVTGPTGSGKTTTLYSILKMINSPAVNISTIEDPVEYRLDNVNQIQVNPNTNLTFADGLRSLLRQDPDVLMVGEIRDEETASIAVNAALTGHLVLATLHTNDAASTLPRMIDMNIEPFLLAATVKMIVSQRLVRNICEKCKKPYTLTIAQLSSLGEKFNSPFDLTKIFQKMTDKDNVTFYKGEGCSSCDSSGYKGRTAIAETLEVSEEIKKMIFGNRPPTDIENVAIKEGMITLFEDGMQKVLDGVTSIEEVLRVMRS